MSKDRLLIIDDEAEFATFVQRVAERHGYEVTATDDPNEFRQRLANWKPTLVILDLQMPGADGVQLLRDLSEQRCDATVLIASGEDVKILETVERLGAERALKMGGSLQKPIRAADLGAVLDRYAQVETALMAGALQHAIANDELTLHYQPVLAVADGGIFGFEALVRWQHPTRGLVPPDQFIPLAEESGLIRYLTAWVMRNAIAEAAAWQARGWDFGVAVNVSALNLDDIELPDVMAAACTDAALPTARVTVEITESAAMRDTVKTMDVLSRLRLKGFHLSLDDFGTGYSSLVELQRLPFSAIKIDKSFVIDMLTSKDAAVIAEIIVELGRKLDLRVVAEGVETERSLARLRELGCFGAQGYYISRPVPAARIAACAESLPRPAGEGVVQAV